MISICGNAAMATAFLFLGPVPFIPLETNLSVIQGMVGLVGFGYALVMVSSFGRAQSAALNLGYVDDINTYIMISGKVSRYLQPNIFRLTERKRHDRMSLLHLSRNVVRIILHWKFHRSYSFWILGRCLRF